MSLRKGTLALTAAALVVALVVLATLGAVPGLVGLAFWAAFLLAALAVERWRYGRILAAPPGPDWRANGEQFVDPETGRTVAVYEHPGSGRRAYVAPPAP
jgi:hypothetical protein